MKPTIALPALIATLLLTACADDEPGIDVDADADAGGRPVGDVGTIPEADGGTEDSSSEADAQPESDAVQPDTTPSDTSEPDATPDAAEDVAPDAALDSAVEPDASGASLGSPCDVAGDCDSNLCVDTTGGAESGICSRPCETTDDCPTDYECYQLTLDGVAVLGVCLPGTYCSDPDDDGYGKGPGCIAEDCEEGAPDIYPGAPELCDGLDNDCNELDDDAVTDLASVCATGDPGLCATGAEVCEDGVPVCVPSFTPTSETCDGLDNDCDGTPDNGLTCDEPEACERVYGGYRCATAGEFTAAIPAGIEDIIVIAWGGGGAGGSQGGGTGGGGGYVFAGGLPGVGPENIRVIVGEGGSAENGGGGASYVYRGATLLAVAGGGGGGASDGCSGCWNGGAGGAGGGAEGQAGEGGTPSSPGSIIYGTPTGGGGGTQTVGGAAGSTSGSTTGSTCLSDGTAGSSGNGGTGGGGGPDCNRGGGGGTLSDGGIAGWGNGSAGGGGAGYFGGGGGGGRYTYYGGGGGGGSSWVNTSVFTGTVELIAGNRQVPGDAADNEFYLGTNARGGDRGTSREETTAGKPGVVVLLLFPPPWF